MQPARVRLDLSLQMERGRGNEGRARMPQRSLVRQSGRSPQINFCREPFADDLADYRQRLRHYCYVEHCEQHTRNRARRKFASLQGLHERLHTASTGRRDR